MKGLKRDRNLIEELKKLTEGSMKAPLAGPLKVVNELKEKRLIRDYALGGGMAALRYTEPFTTLDLDIFFVPSKADLTAGIPEIYDYLRTKGYKPKDEYVVIESVPVQFLATDPLTQEAVEKAEKVRYEGIPTKNPTPEYLIAIAARTGRSKDRVRVEMLLEKADLRKLRGIMKRHGLTASYEKLMGEAP